MSSSSLSTPLSPRDYQMFDRFRVPHDLLNKARVRRVSDEEARDLLTIGRHAAGDFAGIEIPYMSPLTGYRVRSTVRRDHPDAKPDGSPDRKYMASRNDRQHLYFPPDASTPIRDPSIPVLIVESEKAVLAFTAAAERAGRPMLTIGTGGCWGWLGATGKAEQPNGATAIVRGPIGDLDLIVWLDRAVAIAFDGNAATNAHVADARRKLTRELNSRGARVRWIDLPAEPGINGPDDYLAAHEDAAVWQLIDGAGEPPASTYRQTDAGNAEMFAAQHSGRVRFDHARAAWLVWSGHCWQIDRAATVQQLAKEALRSRQAAAVMLTADDAKAKELRWTLQSESRRGIEAMLALARSEPGIAATGDEWDLHPMLLAVANGVVDLETGRLRSGQPSDRITRVAPVAFDASAECPRWERFIGEIFAGYPDLAEYLQRVIGYALTGQTTEQALWILFGTGANGKSTLIETLLRIFGRDLAWTMPFPSVSWGDSQGDYQKASLAGRRFVTSSEVAKQGRLNEELIKSLTGGDSINARHPYGRPFQFEPAAKFFIRVNDKPQIRDESHGMWRRIKLVPFDQIFRIDTTLAPTLAAEAPGILQWAIRGCVAWQREGLREPAVVEAATEEYRTEQDQIAEFMAARCEIVEGVSVRARALFEAYRGWAEGNVRSEERLTQTAFGRRMKSKFSASEGARHVVYFGVRLADADERDGCREAA